jgi:hypothetical protein
MPYFTFQQNNSGGIWSKNPKVAHTVIVEADNAEQANERAMAVGIYFNGVDSGRDCSCCGNRWSPVGRWGEDKGSPFPEMYGEEVVAGPNVKIYHSIDF